MIAWVDLAPPDPIDVLCHISRECARIGLEVDAHRDHAAVLRDARAWLSRGRSEALAQTLLAVERDRGVWRGGEAQKLRIRVSVARRGSLSVRWGYATGGSDGVRPSGRAGRAPVLSLVGAEPDPARPDAARRETDAPSRELLRFRKVGCLAGLSPGGRPPEPLSALVLILVRSCYESLLKQLSQHLEIDLADRFAFSFTRTPERPYQQLQSWTVVAAHPEPSVRLSGAEDRRSAGTTPKVVDINAKHAR